jgi:outer membrane immunogenic protein
MAAQAHAASYEWSGFYIGANVGGAFGDVDLTGVSEDTNYVDINAGQTIPFSPDGVLGGLQIGYNFQFSGGWLFGLEVEGHGMDYDEVATTGGDDIWAVESEWGATGTARLGFLLSSNSLLYVKGGYAAGNVKTHFADTSGRTGSFETDETHGGWVVGGGFEHMIGENVSFGVEYNYLDLGESDHSAEAPDGGGGALGGLVETNVDVQMHVVSARLNWHWNPY